jgi:SPP1 gp7 family putative phage head morphogenesis protein
LSGKGPKRENEVSPQELAKLVREFLILHEKRSALLIAEEFEGLKDELARYLLNRGASIEKIDAILNAAEPMITRRSVRFSSIVIDAQRHVIKKTAVGLNVYLKTSIYRPDLPAIEKLIGRIQNGGFLTDLFKKLKQPMRAAAKDALAEGFAEGLGTRQIASKLKAAADIPFSRALTISRTETNEAYRAATREYYSDSGIKKYVWMAVLDARTCMICWFLHGKIFSSNRKVFSHPNCRCVLVPVTDGMRDIMPGIERIKELKPGSQKEILGPKRFDLFNSGSELSNFIGLEKSDEWGIRYFVRNLPDL